jgi:hypothetical protein
MPHPPAPKLTQTLCTGASGLQIVPNPATKRRPIRIIFQEISMSTTLSPPVKKPAHEMNPAELAGVIKLLKPLKPKPTPPAAKPNG